MKLKTILIMCGLVLLSSLGVKAQTVSWVIQPQYTSIEPYSDQLYKVKSGYQFGLIDKDGQLVVPVMADSITVMRNGHALSLKYTTDGRFKLIGILHSDLSYTNVMADYYVSQYPFFSEDLLPVYNGKNRLGYIDPNGREVIEFNLVEAYPFCEGIASVSKGKGGVLGKISNVATDVLKVEKPKGTLGYVRNDGQFLVIQKNLGKLKQAYSFNNGEALVVTEDGRSCFINPRGQLVREDNNVLISVDEYYAYNPDAAGNRQVAKNYMQNFNGPTTYVDGNKVGYRHGSKIFLLPQFSSAFPFSNNYAIAAVADKYGVLKILSDNFKHNPRFSRIENSSEQMVDYELLIPSEWQNSTLTMFCKLENGIESSCVLQPSNSDKRVFSFSIPAGEKPLFRLEGENLLIWEIDLGASVEAEKDDLEISILSGSVKANAKDIATVGIKITNNTSKVQQLTVSISGDKVSRLNKKISIQPGKSQNVYAQYTNVTKKGVYELNVSLSNGKKASRQINISPFFNNL